MRTRSLWLLALLTSARDSGRRHSSSEVAAPNCNEFSAATDTILDRLRQCRGVTRIALSSGASTLSSDSGRKLSGGAPMSYMIFTRGDSHVSLKCDSDARCAQSGDLGKK